MTARRMSLVKPLPSRPVLTLPTPADSPKPRRQHWTSFLKGKPKQRGELNKLETAYAAHLDLLQAAGQIQWFAYEAISIRLAKGARYTPDFCVMRADGAFECHEVKGYWGTSERLRLKVAAEVFPAKFIAVTKRPKKDGGGWSEEEFGSHE